MFPSHWTTSNRLPIGLGCLGAVIAVCFGLSGCSSLDPQGPGFRDTRTSSLFRQLRQAHQQAQSFAFSNEAREIEKNVGIP